MAGGDAKIKIKVGDVEIDYEGNAAFLKDELLNIFKELNKLNADAPASRTAQHRKTPEDRSGGKSGGKHSIVDIANALEAKTGPDLVMIAAAYLHFTEGKAEFTRLEILAAMKTATGYWHENYLGNLTSALKSLTKSSAKAPAKLRVVREDTFSLPAKESKRLEDALAKAE